MSSENDWLKKLKAGDEVIVAHGYWGNRFSQHRSARHIETVTRTTATQICINVLTPYGETVECKYSRKTGGEIIDGDERRGWLRQPIPQELEQLLMKARIALLHETIHSCFLRDVPLEKLERITAILEEPEASDATNPD